MYKILKADKDSYLTNRVIRIASSGSFRTGSNVGSAGSLDLFKLYGATFDSTGAKNLELSRLVVHFDLQPIKDLIYSNSINISDNSFNCTLKLFDVYGGQTTPSNFDVSVYPLSKSFSEGTGRDVVYYSDFDACNYVSASFNTPWVSLGASSAGGATEICDYITASSLINDFKVTQHFITGEENLEVNVTKIISATLANNIPDSGFRISLDSSQENDLYSYFVKRFASRTAYDESKHPRIIVKYDDSLIDDSLNLRFDERSTLFLRNFSSGEASNILSGSSLTEITGTNSVLLKLVTVVSGNSSYTLTFSGSQHFDGLNYHVGLYSSSFTIPTSNSVLYAELQKSGSVTFTPIWSSLDNSVGYFTSSNIEVFPPLRTSNATNFKNYVLSTNGINSLHRSNENIPIRLNIFDYTSPAIKLVKRPIELPSSVIKKTYYQVRDVTTNEIVIPFDEKYNSTRVSSDAIGMYFTLDTSSLTKERSYVIDIMIVSSGANKIYNSVSNVFKISDTQVN